MQLAPELVEQMVAHAREESPKECCGLLAMDEDGAVVRVYRARNLKDSKVAFEVDGQDHIRAMNDAAANGWEIEGIYHSHPRTENVPSQTDRHLARPWPGMLWLIVALVPEASVRAFRMDGDDVTEL